MTVLDLQKWLVARGAKIEVDGLGGPRTRAAIADTLVNTKASAIDATEEATFAQRCGCALAQLRAVASVESSGGGFDLAGRPKILFERHVFHRLTEGRFSPALFSNRSAGGYEESSWLKLGLAACKDPMAAFQSASWGKFQIMGYHAARLGYADVLEMVWSLTRSEAAHYELLVRFILAEGLSDEMAAISAEPDDCRAFARRYNGAGYERNGYHLKIAAAFARADRAERGRA